MEKQNINLDKNFAIICPHCNTWVLIEEINCAIFRHGVDKNTGFQIPPHLDKNTCVKLFEKGVIFGCGKPFKVVPNPSYDPESKSDDNYKWIAEACDYI
jgi:hypothetical protein